MYAASIKRSAVYLRGTIGCTRCGNAIHVYKVARLASEFTLRCAHCGTRSFYDKRALMIEQLPDRRRRPRS